jgi:hypothetical protein
VHNRAQLNYAKFSHRSEIAEIPLTQELSSRKFRFLLGTRTNSR